MRSKKVHLKISKYKIHKDRKDKVLFMRKNHNPPTLKQFQIKSHQENKSIIN